MATASLTSHPRAGRSLFHHFPIPASLKPPGVGLDISDHAVRFIELLETRKGLRLGACGGKELPPDLIEGGEIRNAEKLGEILASLKKEHGLDEVVTGLPIEKVYLFPMTVPGGTTSLADVRSLIEFKLEENVPLKPEEALFDFEFAGPHEGVETINLIVTVVPRAVAGAYAELFAGAGITPLAFEVEAQATARAAIGADVPEGPTMVVDFGEQKTSVAIVAEGTVQFASIIDTGSITLTTALQGKLNLSFDDAEKMKCERGLTPGAENKDIFATLVDALAPLADEVKRHLSYWDAHAEDAGRERRLIESVVLAGGGANLVGLPEHLSGILKASVVRANVWRNVFSFDEYIPEIPYEESLRYTTSIGLALRGFSEGSRPRSL